MFNQIILNRMLFLRHELNDKDGIGRKSNFFG